MNLQLEGYGTGAEETWDGSECSYGYGNGNGYGSGDTYGSGYGNGDGYGNGYGEGGGCGYGGGFRDAVMDEPEAVA